MPAYKARSSLAFLLHAHVGCQTGRLAAPLEAVAAAVEGALNGPLLMNVNSVGGGVSVEIKLSRSDRVYHAGDKLLGEVVITSTNGPVLHGGVRVAASGSVQMRVSERAVGVFEAFFLNVRPVQLLSETLEVRLVSRSPQSGRLTPPNRLRRRVAATRASRACPLRCRSDRRPRTPARRCMRRITASTSTSRRAMPAECGDQHGR